MIRKIIQISTSTNTASMQGTTQDYYHYVTALCDDGTVWRSVNNKDWHRLKPIPQDETPQATNE